jgi:dephospho-CoA kinase
LVNHYGFQHLSATAFITEEIIRRKLPINRDNMRIIADSLREMYSPDYIIKQLYQKAKAGGKNTIIESIRAIGEAQMLKENHAYLLAVLADSEVRYTRIKKRG